MNTLNGYSKSTLTDKYVLTASGGHRPLADSEFIVGTQTATTGSWTGDTVDSELYDGKQITYWLPYNGSGNATLNLTLAGGPTTGDINCYYGGTSRLTTQYSAGNIIRLVYRENVTIGSTTIEKGWWADANYVDGNTYTSAWCGTAAATAAKTATCSNYTLKTNSYIHVLIRYTNTAASALTLNINSAGAKPIYINGVASSSSNYTLSAGTYLVFYNGTNFYFRTDNILPGYIEKALTLSEWSDTRSVATIPNDYNKLFKVQGIKTAGTTLGLTSTQVGDYATIIGWRGWSDSSGVYAWEIASTNKNRLYVRSGATTTWNNGWSALAYISDIPTKTSQLTNDSNFVTGGPYLPLAGGVMNNGAKITFNANGGIIQTTATTSNATELIQWYKGTAKDANYSYSAQIGWHNMGDTNGAIYLIPNPQNSEPWGGSVGLYIGKNTLKWNNNNLLKAIKSITRSGTTFTYTCLDGTTGTFTQQDNNTTYSFSGGVDKFTVTPSSGSAIDVSVGTLLVNGTYTSNGGEQRPSYIESGKVRWNMMRATTNYFDSAPFSGYCDWMMMDTYTGSDVPYVTMIGVRKSATPHAYIASGAKGDSSGKWAIKTLLDSGNSSVSGGGSSWGSSITVKINGTTKTLTIPAKPTIPTVTDYYWANIKVSETESTTTTPTFGSTVTLNSTGNVILNLTRTSKSSWRFLNDANLRIQNNYTSDVVDYFDVVKIAYSTGNVTLKGSLTASSSSNTVGIPLVLKNSAWYGGMSTAIDFYNGGSYTVPNARIATKMNISGASGGTLIFYTQTAHATTNPNPNGLTERLRIGDDGIITIAKQIERSSGSSWIKARNNAVVKQICTTSSTYQPVVSMKTASGSWSMGTLGSSEKLIVSYDTDENYNANTNSNIAIYFPTSEGTLALTSQIPTKTSQLTNDSNYVTGGPYIPLAGTTGLTGSIVMQGNSNTAPFVRNLTLDATSGWARSIMQIQVDGSPKFMIGAYGDYTKGSSSNSIGYAYIGCNGYNGLNLRITADSLKWGNNDVLHAGNWSSYITIPTLYERNICINDRDWTVYSPYNTNTDRIYAPTSAGTSGQVLVSTGGTPTWQTISTGGGGYIGTTTVSSSQNAGQNITGIGDILPNSTNSYDLGASDKYFYYVYANYVYGSYFKRLTDGDVYLVATNGRVDISCTHASTAGRILLWNQGFTPITTTNLGSATYPWQYVYAKDYYVRGSAANTTAKLTSDAADNIYLTVGGIPMLVCDSTMMAVRSSMSYGGRIHLGTSNYRWNYVYATHLNAEGGSFYTDANGAYWTSDMRLKTNIIKARNLDVADLLVEFDWKESNEHSWGYIAQDLLEVLPEAVSYNSDTDRYAVNYNVAHSAAIASLTARIKELEEKLKKYGIW